MLLRRTFVPGAAVEEESMAALAVGLEESCVTHYG